MLPVHNRRATTEKFIHCLVSQTYDDWHLVLIDDGSVDNTEDMVRTLISDLTVLHGDGKWWWAGALQQGRTWLKRANLPSQDIVLIINDDTEFESDFLANAVKAMQPHSLLLAQAYSLATGKFDELGVCWDWRNLSCTAVREGASFNCFSTRGLFLYLADFMDIGGFHPWLLPHYLSDYEFTMRAERGGFSLITAANVYLKFDDSLTGIRSVKGQTFLRALRMTFSKRSSSNPIYWTNFVLLASPARYIPINVMRVWWRFVSPIRNEVRSFLFPVRCFCGRVKRKIKRLWAIS